MEKAQKQEKTIIGWKRIFSRPDKKYFYRNDELGISVWTAKEARLMNTIKTMKKIPKHATKTTGELFLELLKTMIEEKKEAEEKSIKESSIIRYIDNFLIIYQDIWKEKFKGIKSLKKFTNSKGIELVTKYVNNELKTGKKPFSFSTKKNKIYTLMTILHSFAYGTERRLSEKVEPMLRKKDWKNPLTILTKKQKIAVNFMKNEVELLPFVKKAITHYQKWIDKVIYPEVKKLEEFRKTNMTKTEKERWIDYPELQKKVLSFYYDKIKDMKINSKKKPVLTKKEHKLLQEYLVANLYLLDINNWMPLRNEYATMKIIHQKDYNALTDEEQNSKNWLLLIDSKHKEFLLNDRKVESKPEDSSVPKGLNDVINLYLKFYPNSEWKEKQAPFLLNTNVFNKNQAKKRINNALSTNGLTKLLTRMMLKIVGLQISSTMLRKIIHTHKYPEIKALVNKCNEKKESMKKDAKIMGHSVNTGISKYNKGGCS
jgi:hypothetical protein